MASDTETRTENKVPVAEDHAALRAEVAAKTEYIETLKGQLAEASTNFEGAKAAYAYAVEDFRKLAAASNPLIPAEAIYGTTVAEIKASLDRAGKLVANVQEAMLKQAQAASVPAGAPARTGPDLSALSTKEKINLGLEKARKRKEA